MMDAPLYFAALRELREEFKDEIQIHIGFEMEFYPAYFDQMLKIATSLGAEYLILGQHYIRYGEETQHTSIKPTSKEEDLAYYVDTVIQAMETGVFTYVAHPDLLNFVGSDEIYEKHMRRLCQAAVRCEVPLEINFLGIRDQRCYPRDHFWKIAGEEGCEVVYGCDAHHNKHAYDAESLKIAQEITERYALRYNPTPDIVHPITKEKTSTNDSTKKA
jgi:histidinol-phosphatase (PHP family)